MDDIWECLDCLTAGGFLPLLWETLQCLGYTEPPTYYYCEYDVAGVLKCEMHLHITEHPEGTKFKVRCIPAIQREPRDTCQIATCEALMIICQENDAEVNNTHARYFPVMDQTSLIWRKKIKAMEKAKPQTPEYILMTIAKYLHALDILYKNQERELKIRNTKLKEAEAEVQALRMELLMLNSQLSTMREEKVQCKQEL